MISQALFVPETNRKIVGNGSLAPWEWWNRSLFDRKREKWNNIQEYEKEREIKGLPPRQKVGWPNPWPSLVVMKEKDTAMTLICIALNFAAFYGLMTSIPALYSTIYKLDTLKLSLGYM